MAAVTLAMALSACSPTSPASSSGGSRPTTASTSSTLSAAHTVWLCKPGTAGDPCTIPLGATSVAASGKSTYVPARAASAPSADCFYVYPTVSTEKTINSDLAVQPAEIVAAEDQASRFSQVCRVWAPMYRQVTLQGLAQGYGFKRKYIDIALTSLESSFEGYLAHYNDGRPIVFIGHSQGAAMLILMLEQLVDGNASLRDRMVSAIILGGNVEVPTGKLVGGSFRHIPACTSATELHCVIAYSSFLRQPPADAMFGIPGQGVSLQSFQTKHNGLRVVCTNPMDLAARSGKYAGLKPYFLGTKSGPFKTLWTTYPGLYKATCESKGDATWLQVTPTPGKGDTRPIVSQTLGPGWGLHLYDVNLSFGGLVQDAKAEIAAYEAHA
jgi:hypothetical protein